MLITMLVRQGRQEEGERWDVEKELRNSGAGVNILSRPSSDNIGKELMVEFTVDGIVWRRTIFALIAPKMIGVERRVLASIVQETINGLAACFETEANGGMPMLTLMTLLGNAMMPPLAARAVYDFEEAQLRELHGRHTPEQKDLYLDVFDLLAGNDGYAEGGDLEDEWVEPGGLFDYQDDTEPFLPFDDEDIDTGSFDEDLWGTWGADDD